MADETFRIEQGALTEVPLYDEHRNAKNWAATVTRDPTSPGGLDRRWWSRSGAGFFYLVPDDLAVGDVVEFAAKRSKDKRIYAIVAALSDDELHLDMFNDAGSAFGAATDFEASGATMVSFPVDGPTSLWLQLQAHAGESASDVALRLIESLATSGDIR